MKRMIQLTAILCLTAASAEAAPAQLAVDVAAGAVIVDVDAGHPHHPASLTKMMTAYVAFAAMEEGRASGSDTVTVSDRAAAQGGSVLGLRRGDRLSLDTALRAMIVRSANDAAVAVAEHLAGDEAAFARRMTEIAARLGMTATSFRNATGMTAEGHVTTPRDMAVLALAIERDFPARRALFSAREVSWKGRSLPSVNGFLSAYPGAEGMKTGFTCPAGYNLVALAHRGGRRALAVVMGAESSAERLGLIRRLMDRALTAPAPGTVQLAALGRGAGSPPDHSPGACGLAARSGRGEAAGAVAATSHIPKGWGLEVALGADRAKVKAETEKVLRALRGRLGGGSVAVVIRPRDGMVRHRGLIVGLDEGRARSVCLAERARLGEDICMVMTPAMLGGAVEEERRFRMISAR